LISLSRGSPITGKVLGSVEFKMPWSLLGYAFVVASALVFKRMNAILAEFDRTDDDGAHFDNAP
jgi:hypothetical protein